MLDTAKIVEDVKAHISPREKYNLGWYLAYAYKKVSPEKLDYDELHSAATELAAAFEADADEVYTAALTHYPNIVLRNALETAIARGIAEPATPPYPKAGMTACVLWAAIQDLAAHHGNAFVLPQVQIAKLLGVTQQRVSGIIRCLEAQKLLICRDSSYSKADKIAKVWCLASQPLDTPF